MSICKECGGITSEYSGTPCTCPVVVPPAPTVVEAHSVEYKREYARAGREFAGSDESMFSCGYAYGVIVGKRAAQLELDRLKADLKLANEAYEILTGLLNRRFPPTPEGLPDFKVEDVLRENVALTRQRDGLVKALEDISKSADGRWSADHAIAALAAARKETNDR